MGGNDKSSVNRLRSNVVSRLFQHSPRQVREARDRMDTIHKKTQESPRLPADPRSALPRERVEG